MKRTCHDARGKSQFFGCLRVELLCVGISLLPACASADVAPGPGLSRWPWQKAHEQRQRQRQRLEYTAPHPASRNLRLEGDQNQEVVIRLPARLVRDLQTQFPAATGNAVVTPMTGSIWIAALALTAALTTGGARLARSEKRAALTGLLCVSLAICCVGCHLLDRHDDEYARFMYLNEVGGESTYAGSARLMTSEESDVVVRLPSAVIEKVAGKLPVSSGGGQ